MAGHHLWLLRQHPDFECDFETARRIVYSDARKTWDGFGTLYVAPHGSEDATHWQVIAGAPRWAVSITDVLDGDACEQETEELTALRHGPGRPCSRRVDQG